MSLISKVGTFRGIPTDCGVGVTKNGFPQFVVNLLATEYYDAQEQEWVDCSENDEQTLAYLVLFGGDGKPTLTAKQIQKVFNWSGQSFQELNDGDYVETKLQFRIEEHEYNDNVTLQVSWIDEYDAVPGRKVNKLDAKDLKKLDSLYASNLKQFGGTKVASAPKPTGKPAVPAMPTAPPNEDRDNLSAPPKTAISGGKCTKVEAWRAVVEKKEELAPDLTDEELGAVWTDAIQKVAPTAKKGNLTQAQWYKVREEVTAVLTIGF